MIRAALLALALIPGTAFAASKDGHEFTSFHGFTLGEANLGDAGDSEVSVCYLAENETLVFRSHGDKLAEFSIWKVSSY